MIKRTKQVQTASYIRVLLESWEVKLKPRRTRVKNQELWLVFQLGVRGVGVDPRSGVWLRDTPESDWRCLARTSDSGAVLISVEFLVNEPCSR